MLTAALWTLGAAVAAGLGLSCFYLLERPILGAARVASWGHGLAGGAGTILLALSVWRLSDVQGFGSLAAWMIGGALLGGLLVVVAQLRKRRPAGLIVAIHATLGVAGYVILIAFMAGPH